MKTTILLIPAILLAIATPLRSQNISTAEWGCHASRLRKDPRQVHPLGDSRCHHAFHFFQRAGGLYEDGISGQGRGANPHEEKWALLQFFSLCLARFAPPRFALEAYQSYQGVLQHGEEEWVELLATGCPEASVQKQLIATICTSAWPRSIPCSKGGLKEALR